MSSTKFSSDKQLKLSSEKNIPWPAACEAMRPNQLGYFAPTQNPFWGGWEWTKRLCTQKTLYLPYLEYLNRNGSISLLRLAVFFNIPADVYMKVCPDSLEALALSTVLCSEFFSMSSHFALEWWLASAQLSLTSDLRLWDQSLVSTSSPVYFSFRFRTIFHLFNSLVMCIESVT